MLKEKLQKASKKALNVVKRTHAASAMMAVAMGAAALSSCSYDSYVDSAGRAYTRKTFNLNNISGGNRSGWLDINGGGGGCWGGVPMYSGNRGWYSNSVDGHRSGFAPGDTFLGYNRAGQGVIRVAQPMLSADAKDLITKTDKDGNEWQVAKGTKLPKSFKVIVTEDKTIPVPAAKYDQITAALDKGELNFVVDANGQYGLVPQATANSFKTGTLTFEGVAKTAEANLALKAKAKAAANQK